MNQTVVPVMLNDGATLPKKAHRNDAGYDLTLPKARAIQPGERIVINTGVHVAIPQGHVGLDAVKPHALDADTVTSVYDSATYALASLTEIEQEPMP